MRTHIRRERIIMKDGHKMIVEKKTQVVKRIVLKVIIDGKAESFQARPSKGCYYNSKDIEETLHRMAEFLEKKHPKLEFRMVPVNNNLGYLQYNFIACGEREETAIAEIETVHNDASTQGSTGQN